MYKVMNVSKNGIVGSGNGVRKNPALISLLENKFGSKMLVTKYLEEASVGAALYGLVSCGVFKNAKDVQRLIEYI